MKKKLPEIYKGIVKNINKNQRQIILSNNDELKQIDDSTYTTSKGNVNKKIKDIFNSPNYVYKANVSITMQDGKNIKKTIVGRTNNSLITIDDELIDVSKISQIDFLD